MGGKRPVDDPGGREQPRPSVRLQDEGVVAPNRLLGAGVVRREVIRALVRLEIGDVLARPRALLVVPPDVLLALGPRPPVRIGGRAVVDDAAVGPPTPRPLPRPPGRHPGGAPPP